MFCEMDMRSRIKIIVSLISLTIFGLLTSVYLDCERIQEIDLESAQTRTTIRVFGLPFHQSPHSTQFSNLLAGSAARRSPNWKKESGSFIFRHEKVHYTFDGATFICEHAAQLLTLEQLSPEIRKDLLAEFSTDLQAGQIKRLAIKVDSLWEKYYFAPISPATTSELK
jgi:hypothetical protein